jgi:hypothetical protein
MEKINVVEEIRELKNQLAYSKNIGFFFGAGTSCALGIPNIAMLTSSVENQLKGNHLSNYKIVVEDLSTVIIGRSVNIEDILNQIRRIREITNDRANKEFLKIDGESAKKLDKEICAVIHEIISEKEGKSNLEVPKKFFGWLNILNRDYSKEVFTTNYDLIIEKSLEASRIPYFDGFVGSYEPFFWQESIDLLVTKYDITRNWIRLWKVHGSLNWFWAQDASNRTQRIIRVGKFDKSCIPDHELVIYPSKDKYETSRKQPFIAYFDRLKNYLLSGELLFVFAGYSFSDEHINEIVFNCLRQNNRLFCVVFFYQDSEVENLHSIASSYMNLNVFGPTKAIVNGILDNWDFKKEYLKDTEKYDAYWDEGSKKLKLGDFNQLVNFLVSYSGKAELINISAK